MLNLQAESLDWALQHALNYGDTDIFPPLFEYKAIEHDWSTVRAFLEEVNVLTWPTRTARICVVPKGRFAFRVGTQLDPLDFLLYAATVYEIAAEIERRRTPARRHVVFSWRVGTAPDGRLFDPTVSYSAFQTHSSAQVALARCSYVAVADISDFYHRIYHHRLENALATAAPNRPHVKGVMSLLGGWNGNASYSVPVGPAPSRLLAELTLADVDDALLAEQFRFARFNDDFRIFVGTSQEGYQALARLARLLYEMHGLTLQPGKTSVLTVDEFRRRLLPSEHDREVDRLRDRFRALAQQLGLHSEYEEIDIDALNDEQRATIDSMNLADMLSAEIAGEDEPDFSIVRFALRKLGQLGNPNVLEVVMANIERLYPAFDTVIEYLTALPSLTPTEKARIGGKILRQMDRGVLSELEYHRMWALELFTGSTEWNNVGKLRAFGGVNTDHFTRRSIILALGNSREVHWFSARRGEVMQEAPWARRAFLRAASCMAPDATRHWYRSLRSRLDPLEVAVTKWSAQNPFRG